MDWKRRRGSLEHRAAWAVRGAQRAIDLEPSMIVSGWCGGFGERGRSRGEIKVGGCFQVEREELVVGNLLVGGRVGMGVGLELELKKKDGMNGRIPSFCLRPQTRRGFRVWKDIHDVRLLRDAGTAAR